jgi:signal transduction histidine kinase
MARTSRLPRRTARLRLTLLCSGMCLVLGIFVIAVLYALASTSPKIHVHVSQAAPGPAARSVVPPGAAGPTVGHALLSVANTGPVVPAGQLDRLFEPFQRLDVRTGGNHGLGLSIVRAIANAHGADLSATAQPTGGLSVTVRFARAGVPDA